MNVGITQVIKDVIARRLLSMHFTLVGEVVNYDPSTQLADVKPAIKILASLPGRLKQLAELPTYTDIPVVWPGGGSYGLHCPLAAGDSVLLLCSDQSTERWRDGAPAPVDAGDYRRNSIDGAFALPFIRKDIDAWSDLGSASSLRVGLDGGNQIDINATDVQIAGGADFVALAAKVDSALSSIVTYLSTHVHTSAAPGSPSSPPTVAPPSPATVAATKVKAT